MAWSAQTQAACFLLLILVSLASGSLLQHQTGEGGELQVPDSAEAQTGLTARLHRLWKQDRRFPICIFCCNCCSMSKCGFCCKT